MEVDFSRHVDKKLPAADQIYQGLREAIIFGNFRPNEAISENRVCGMFNVSRSPVRIALTRLVGDKLIDIFPQRGSFVSPIILQKVREGHFARVALELAVLKEAAKTGPAKGQVNRLHEMLPHYYEIRGWTADGRPTADTLKRLDV